MASRSLRALVGVALLTFPLACSFAERPSRLPLCEVERVNTADWVAVEMNAANVALQMPQGFVEISETPPQILGFPGGGTVSLWWDDSDWAAYLDSVGREGKQDVCVDSTGQFVSLLRWEWVPSEGHAPTGPGLYLTAVLASQGNRDLVMVGHWHSQRRDTLAAVLHTVRWRN
jgi:hypothetical protein